MNISGIVAVSGIVTGNDTRSMKTESVNCTVLLLHILYICFLFILRVYSGRYICSSRQFNI